MAAEFWNVIFAAIGGFLLGLVVHSAWNHSRARGEFKFGFLCSIFKHNEYNQPEKDDQEDDET